MDWLRSAYSAMMKTIIGGAAVPIRWFKTAPGTPMFKGASVFRSRNWCDPKDNDEIGEQYDPDVCCGTEGDRWVNGQRAAGFIAGSHPCGTDVVAATGAGPTDPTFVTNPNGSAPCCAPEGSFTSFIYIAFSYFKGDPSTVNSYPPPGQIVLWTDSDGHTGSFVSGGDFTDVPYGYFGASHYLLRFNLAVDPPVCFTQWPVSVDIEGTQAWGVGYLRRFVHLAGQPLATITTYTW